MRRALLYEAIITVVLAVKGRVHRIRPMFGWISFHAGDPAPSAAALRILLRLSSSSDQRSDTLWMKLLGERLGGASFALFPEIEGREKQTTRRRSKVWLWLEVGRLGLSSEESLSLEVGRWASRWLSIELECCFCSSTR